MIYACLSDPHMTWGKPIGRLDDVKQTGIEKFEYVLDWCKRNKAELLIAGDLTDGSHGWYLYLALMNLMIKYKVKIRAVYGQHDMYFRTIETTILNALVKNDLVEILTHDHQKIYNLYGSSWNDDHEIKMPEVVRTGANESILVVHGHISTKAVYPGGNYIDAKKLIREVDAFDLIVCGDIHRKFKIEYKKRFIVNSGPMLRLDADEHMFEHKPGFWAYDSKKKTVDWEEIPHKPAEEVLSREHIERKIGIEITMNDFIDSINSDFDFDISFEENVMLFMEENNIEEEVKELLMDKMKGE